jgi:hypothetical protein
VPRFSPDRSRCRSELDAERIASADPEDVAGEIEIVDAPVIIAGDQAESRFRNLIFALDAGDPGVALVEVVVEPLISAGGLKLEVFRGKQANVGSGRPDIRLVDEEVLGLSIAELGIEDQVLAKVGLGFQAGAPDAEIVAVVAAGECADPALAEAGVDVRRAGDGGLMVALGVAVGDAAVDRTTDDVGAEPQGAFKRVEVRLVVEAVLAVVATLIFGAKVAAQRI